VNYLEIHPTGMEEGTLASPDVQDQVLEVFKILTRDNVLVTNGVGWLFPTCAHIGGAMVTTGLDQQSLDQAVVLTWAGTTEVSRPHWAEQMVWVGCFPLRHI
jgi:hypothetical protein